MEGRTTKGKPIDVTDWIEWILLGITGLLVVLLVFYVVLAVRDSYKPTFELRKDQWTCVSTKKETTYVLVGKVMVPTTNDVCVEYKRN